MAHTPEPWKIVQESIDPEWHVISAVGGRVIANVHTEAGNEMDRANARLLVAAPDLMEALQGILGVIAVRIDDPRIKQFDAARAARTKATGF